MRQGIGNGWNTVFLPNSKISIKSLFMVKNERTREKKRK